MRPAPLKGEFPAFPASWYLFCPWRALRKAPVSRDVVGRRLVAFRGTEGRVAVLDARCAHFGADLGRGRVIGDVLQCPFHHWEYDALGRCVRIPADKKTPVARQPVYPSVERHGFVFFFNGPHAPFPMPFFPDCHPDELRPARPFETILQCPWYLIGANHFDLQHFLAAHDRQLVGQPHVCAPAPFARRASGRFRIIGRSLQDRLTRWFAGEEVTMTITDWCGTMMFTTATFRSTTSYGMTLVEPLPNDRVLVRVIVFVRRSAARLGQVLLDPLRLWLRRLFIKRFLAADRALLDGIAYTPGGLIEADEALADYLHWLARGSENCSAGAAVQPPHQGSEVACDRWPRAAAEASITQTKGAGL
jgi:nitrite reductase/ring-hydroxylating ferredoxin subunit